MVLICCHGSVFGIMSVMSEQGEENDLRIDVGDVWAWHDAIVNHPWAPDRANRNLIVKHGQGVIKEATGSDPFSFLNLASDVYPLAGKLQTDALWLLVGGANRFTGEPYAERSIRFFTANRLHVFESAAQRTELWDLLGDLLVTLAVLNDRIRRAVFDDLVPADSGLRSELRDAFRSGDCATEIRKALSPAWASRESLSDFEAGAFEAMKPPAGTRKSITELFVIKLQGKLDDAAAKAGGLDPWKLEKVLRLRATLAKRFPDPQGGAGSRTRRSDALNAVAPGFDVDWVPDRRMPTGFSLVADGARAAESFVGGSTSAASVIIDRGVAVLRVQAGASGDHGLSDVERAAIEVLLSSHGLQARKRRVSDWWRSIVHASVESRRGDEGWSELDADAVFRATVDALAAAAKNAHDENLAAASLEGSLS